MAAQRYRAYDDDGHVLNAGECDAEGRAKFKAKEVVAKVVFYSGDEAEETVCGSVDVNASGDISAAIIEPE